MFAAIPGEVSAFGPAIQSALSGNFTKAVGPAGKCAKAPATQVAGYVGYSTSLSIAASQDYTLAAVCVPSGDATNGGTPTQDFIGTQSNYLSVGSNGFRAQLDNNTTALNAWTDASPALFMASRKGNQISAYVPSGVTVTAATGTRAQTFSTIAAGRYAGNNMTTTQTYLIMVWGRAVSLAEYMDLAKNPWKIFAPSSIKIFIPSGSSTLSGSASGGAIASGSGALSANVALAGVGVAVAGGSASAGAAVPLSATGFSVASGSATGAATVQISASGLAQA
ncbi:MAG TPA: hypothetical protein PKY50_19285, partial [Candidatus Competibacter sp.]|nr:hypothetical protein [Candidatus Competibacter sp.]